MDCLIIILCILQFPIRKFNIGKTETLFIYRISTRFLKLKFMQYNIFSNTDINDPKQTS